MNESITCAECGANGADVWRTDPRFCFTCGFWLEKVAWVGDPAVARIAGRHYRIGPENTPKFNKGSNGERFIISFDDGRSAETTNLWTQGRIPERFRDRLPDNARFVEPRELTERSAA